MSTPALTTYRDQFAAFSKNGGGEGPAWLPALRRRAFDQFTALGFPTQRNEDWHYTSLAPIAETSFTLASPPVHPVVPAAAQRHFTPQGSTLVFVNGAFARELSSFAALPAEVEISTLGDAMIADSAFMESSLGSLAAIDTNTFAALNTAFVRDGVVVRIPANVEVGQPLHILWVATDAAAGSLISPRLFVDAGAHSRITIVETFVGESGVPYLTNAVAEVRVGDGARVDVLKVQEESRSAFHVSTLQAAQGRDSVFHAFSFAAGARLSRTNVYTTMASPGAEARLNGLYLLDGDQHCDHQTYVHHAAEQCASRELYKGILDGASHGVFNGKVLVDAIAQKTDGKQTNHALLLSDHARVDTKPQLEIFADDVKCTHGATVGRLDDTALFYLKSRGINRDMARALLTYAFAAEVLETIELVPLRDSLKSMAFERYNQAPSP